MLILRRKEGSGVPAVEPCRGIRRRMVMSFAPILDRIPAFAGFTHPWTTSPASAARIPTARSTANATPATSRSAAATASTSSIRLLYCNACKARFSERKGTPLFRSHLPRGEGRSPSSSTSPRAAASARPAGSSASTATPSSGWPASPASTPTTLTTSSWLFPPRTREVQFDEKWSFVAKKQKNCDPDRPGRRPQGGLVGPRRLRPRAPAGPGGRPRGARRSRTPRRSSPRSRTAPTAPRRG